jgi:hypothetical protein
MIEEQPLPINTAPNKNSFELSDLSLNELETDADNDTGQEEEPTQKVPEDPLSNNEQQINFTDGVRSLQVHFTNSTAEATSNLFLGLLQNIPTLTKPSPSYLK